MIGENLRKLLFLELKKIFTESNVATRQRVSTNSSDDLEHYMYTPEPDIIIGPCNTSRQIDEDNKKINSAYRQYKSLLKEVNRIAIKKFNENSLNKNPRYFMAIEVGGSGSMKHLLGDMFNASVLGKVGLVIGADDNMVKKYQRIFEFVNFAYDVNKINHHFANIAILNGIDFLGFLRREVSRGNF